MYIPMIFIMIIIIIIMLVVTISLLKRKKGPHDVGQTRQSQVQVWESAFLGGRLLCKYSRT